MSNDVESVVEYWYGTYHGTKTFIHDADVDPGQALYNKFAREGHLTLVMASWSVKVHSTTPVRYSDEEDEDEY